MVMVDDPDRGGHGADGRGLVVGGQPANGGEATFQERGNLA